VRKFIKARLCHKRAKASSGYLLDLAECVLRVSGRLGPDAEERIVQPLGRFARFAQAGGNCLGRIGGNGAAKGWSTRK
jgi:hypothetical protein